MASYSQPSYQQPYYGTPYQQPPPAPMMGGGYYGAPQGYPMPQAPVYQMDAASFRREFTTRLAELNVNSRPLIQGLSTLAHDHVRYGDIAAQCLEAHIRRVSQCRQVITIHPDFFSSVLCASVGWAVYGLCIMYIIVT